MTVASPGPTEDSTTGSSNAGVRWLERISHGLRDPGWPLSLTWLRAFFGRRLFLVWLVLALWTVLWGAISIRNGLMGSWGIFPNAARILFSGADTGGFHLYFTRPDYQFGPVATLAAAPLAHLTLLTSKWIAGILMTLCGLWLAAVVAGFGPRGTGLPTPGPVLVGGLLLMPVWTSLTLTSGHLDDVLALGFGLLGILQVWRGKPIWAAVLLALAVDSKPWALAFAVALVALPRPQWIRSFVVWAAVILVAWLPFFLIEPRTVEATKYKLLISPASVLSIFDISGLSPPWVRPAQLILAVAVSVILARAGAPQAILLATVASRILLDPEVASYYTAGAVLVAYLADRSLVGRIPWFAISAIALLWVPQLLEDPSVAHPFAGWLRLLWAVGTLVALVATFRSRREPVVGPQQDSTPTFSRSENAQSSGV